MKGKWAVPVLASILILGTLGLSNDAFAGKGDNNGNKGCENANPNSKACEKNPNTEPPADTEPPIITASTTPTPNANGWNNSDVTVSFNCVDSLSGVASVTASILVSTEGANQQLIGTCTDNEGNSATVSVFVSIDKTPPNITASTSPPPNANGWNNSDVTVSFNCVDSLSGAASLTSPVIVTTEGENQSVLGTCTDVAGNSSSVSVFVSLDKTAVTPIITNPVDGQVLTNNLPTISGTAEPNDSITILVDGVVLTTSVSADGTGFWTITLSVALTDSDHTFSAQSTDLAGNVSSLDSVTISIDTTP